MYRNKIIELLKIIFLRINVLINVHKIGKHLGALIIKTLPIVSG